MELSLPLFCSLSLFLTHTRTHTQVSERGFSCVSQSATKHNSEREPLVLSNRLFCSPLSLQHHAHLIIFSPQPHYNNFLIYSKPQSQQQTHIQHTQLLWFWYTSTTSTRSTGTSPCIYSAVFFPRPYLECMWQSAVLITPSCPTKMAQKKMSLKEEVKYKKKKKKKERKRCLPRTPTR